MNSPQTESSTMKILEETGWHLSSWDFPSLTIVPPRDIDALTHNSLLEESLEKYRDVWGILASR